MCGGDDHLAWKRPISSKACRGLRTTGETPSLHVGTSKGLQSLFGHGLDSVFPLLVSSQSRGGLSSLFREIRHGSAVVIVDQFTTTMAFIQEALANLRQDIDMPQAPPYLLHGHSEVTTPTVVHTTVFEDTHARMDRIEQRIRELTLEGAAWLMDLDGNQFSEPTNVDQLKKYYV
ncbi:hypothetical protein CK203_034285 [Vitis vinifera]|uniref:Uncharacterized protein n=1 Tax=Vitis vinifera TaxID=29760 RepID=A0A438INQ4_VITVI|nr:hypothetical protein CK203_034285 [Vitis vinifera]